MEIHFPTADQKVWGSSPYECPTLFTLQFDELQGFLFLASESLQLRISMVDVSEATQGAIPSKIFPQPIPPAG